tara:strand:- start:435540 stop:437831 length:2292 start_codon:yes stop_codon:yes gene_type:complete
MSVGPSNQTSHTTAIASRVARSLLVRSWIGYCVASLPAALGVGLLLVIAQRWWIDEAWWWGIPLVLVGIVVIGAGVRAWARRASLSTAAGWLDESAQTQSRFRSALELIRAPNADQAFASLAVERAEATAASTKIPSNQSVLQREQSKLSVSGVLLVLVVVAGMFMPTKSIGGSTIPTPSPAAIADAKAHIEEQQQDLEELAALSDDQDPLIDQALKDLQALEQELTATESDSPMNPDRLPPDPESASAMAESRIEQLASELDKRAVQQQLEDQTLREQLDKLKSESLSNESELERFREQLAEGKYEEAIQELDQIKDRLDSMTDEQRQQAAEDMDAIADAIKPDPSPPSEPESARPKREEPQTQDPQPPEQDQNPESDSPKPNDAKDLSEALEREAEEIRKPKSESNPEQEKPNQDDSDQDESEPNADQKQDQSSRDGKEGGDQSDPNKPGDREDNNSNTPKQQPTQGQQSEEPQSKETPGQEKPAQSPSERPGDEPDKNSTEQAKEQPGQQPGEQTEDEEPTEPSDSGSQQQQSQQQEQSPQNEGDQQQPGSEPGSQPQSQPQSQPGSEQSPNGQRTLREQLEEAQRRSDGAQQDRSKAERLREQLDRSQETPPDSTNTQPSPNSENDQRGSAPGSQKSEQRLQEPNEGASDQEFVPVQAVDENARADESSAPVGQWYNPDGDRPLQTEQSETAKRFRDASKQARDQINDRRVPRKYRDVIRQYFDQLDQRASKLAPSSDGADATQPAPAPEPAPAEQSKE